MNVLEDDARPMLRWVGIAIMIAGGAVAGYVTRLAQEPVAPAAAKPPKTDDSAFVGNIRGGHMGGEGPCTDSIVSASEFSGCPDHRQHIKHVIAHEWDHDELVCSCSP